MQPLQSFSIVGSSVGLELDKKPFLLPDQAFPVLKNAYVWRDRVVKEIKLSDNHTKSFVGNYQSLVANTTVWTRDGDYVNVLSRVNFYGK